MNLDSDHDARRVLLVGAGGHARVCLEALLDTSGREVVGAVSSDGTGRADLGVDLLGRTDDIAAIVRDHGITAAFIAVGDNAARCRLHQVCRTHGLAVITATSRYAMPSLTAVYGAGVALLAGAAVNAAAQLGIGTIVNTNASVDHDGMIGEFVHIAPGAAVGGDVTIDDLALIGTGARVLPGIRIGRAAVVGAGAVVIDDVAAGVTVVGVPARPLARP